MVPVVIALGSNVGDSLGFLRSATTALEGVLTDLRTSRVYRTAPMYVEDQPPYLNAAVSGFSDLGPLSLLKELKSLEAAIGRETRGRYGPREIDLDLVSYGALALRTSVLQVPHPRCAERRFVLAPMQDLDPNLRLATMGTVQELLSQTESQAQDVVPIEDALLSVPSHG